MIKNIIISLCTVFCLAGASLVAGNAPVGEGKIKVKTDVRTVTAVSQEDDPYTGYYVDEYHVQLNDKQWWILGWKVYEKNGLTLEKGDQVCVMKINNSFYMLVPHEDQEPSLIRFEKDGDYFYAY